MTVRPYQNIRLFQKIHNLLKVSLRLLHAEMNATVPRSNRSLDAVERIVIRLYQQKHFLRFRNAEAIRQLAPTEEPLLARLFPLLSTWMMASIIGFQSTFFAFSAGSAPQQNTGNNIITLNINNTILFFLFILIILWSLSNKESKIPAINVCVRKS